MVPCKKRGGSYIKRIWEIYHGNGRRTVRNKCREEYYPYYLKIPRHFATLTDRELVVLKLIARGLNNTQLAEELQLSLGTVKFHVKNIMMKLQVENRTVAVKIAQKEGILENMFMRE